MLRVYDGQGVNSSPQSSFRQRLRFCILQPPWSMIGSRSMSVLSGEKVPLNDGKINIDKNGEEKKLIRIGGTKKYEIKIGGSD